MKSVMKLEGDREESFQAERLLSLLLHRMKTIEEANVWDFFLKILL